MPNAVELFVIDLICKDKIAILLLWTHLRYAVAIPPSAKDSTLIQIRAIKTWRNININLQLWVSLKNESFSNVNDKNFPDILIFFINEVAKGS